MEKENDTLFLSLQEQAKTLLSENLVNGVTEGSENLNYTYICPDKKLYPHQGFWDSCFHIIVNTHLNHTLAKQEFETIMKVQRGDGFLAHMVFWKGNITPVDKVLRGYYNDVFTSSLTQTPIIAFALKKIYENTRDKPFLTQYLPRVKKYFDFIFNSRIFADDDISLPNIIHTLESGLDNSPIYDEPLKIKSEDHFVSFQGLKSALKQLQVLKQCNWDLKRIQKHNFFLCKDLVFNCTFVQGYRELAQLYNEMGNNLESERCTERAKSLEDLILKECWDSEKGLFFPLFGRENVKCDVKSAASLIPLFLDGLPFNKAIVLVEDHLTNEHEFWTKFPVPTIAIDEPSYSDRRDSMWRGPTWITINWFLINGLKKHGFESQAIDLAQKTLNMVAHSGFREFYSATTGKGMGAQSFSNSALIVDIINNIFTDDNLDWLLNREWLHVKRTD